MYRLYIKGPNMLLFTNSRPPINGKTHLGTPTVMQMLAAKALNITQQILVEVVYYTLQPRHKHIQL